MDDSEDLHPNKRKYASVVGGGGGCGGGVSLHLPPGVVIPKFYTLELDAQALSDALQVGASTVAQARACFDSMQFSRALADERKKLEDVIKLRYAADAERVRAESTHGLELLKLDLARAQHVIQGLQEDVVQEQARRQGLEQAVEARLGLAHKQHAEALQAVLDTHKAERELAAQQLTAVRMGHTNSSVKGALGEEDAEALIKKAFNREPGFCLYNESKLAGRGDRLMEVSGMRVMWEMKSHSAVRDASAATSARRKVETKDVKKFQDNVSSASDFDMAVMVALHTNITGKDKYPVEIEYIGNVCVLYVNRLMEQDDPVFFLQWHVGNLLSAHAKLRQTTTIHNDTEAASGGDATLKQQQLARLAATVSEHMAESGQAALEQRRFLMKQKAAFEKFHDDLVDQLKRAENLSQHVLQNIVCELLK